MLALLVGALGFSPERSSAGITERIVTNPYSGLAISGYDPVAYFTKAQASAGRPEFEARHAGVVWRFGNAGNRAAFLDQPAAYMPVFGGYDPVDVARGVAVAGHPELWLILKDRLYLFHTAQARSRFAASAEQILAIAEQQWPQLERTLVQ